MSDNCGANGVLVLKFCDNGAFSHYQVVDKNTGRVFVCQEKQDQLEAENAELRKQPSDWPTTGLFRHLVAGSEKKGKKETSDCITCALAEECDLKNLRCKNFLPRRKNEEQDCAKCLNYQECVRGVDIFMFECASFKEKEPIRH